MEIIVNDTNIFIDLHSCGLVYIPNIRNNVMLAICILCNYTYWL